MKQTFLHTKSEIQWIRLTHLNGIPLKRIPLSAVIIGCETAPIAIELYRSHFPHVTEKPFQIIKMEDGYDPTSD